MSTGRRILHVLNWVAFWAVIAVAGLMLVPSLLGYDRYVIVSGSMEPAIGTGSVVYDRAVPVEDLAVGDIITFLPPPEYNPEEPVTHRIHEISRAPQGTTVNGKAAGGALQYRTKGDANKDVDPWTIVFDKPDQARVEHHIEKLGYVYIALSNRWVQLLVIGLPAAVIFVLICIALWREAGDAVAREERQKRARPARTVGVATLAVSLLLTATASAVFSDTKSNPQTLQATTWQPTPPPGAGLKVIYRNNTPNYPSDNAITPWLQVVNGSTSAQDLTKVTVRYWFTKDSSQAVNIYCDYAWLDCTPTGKITTRIVPVSPARPKADTYAEVVFKPNAGTLPAGDTTYDIQLRIHKSDYSNFDETNDYSYGTNSSFQDWPKATLYYGGTLVWGTEP
jgi:signal peptidase I